MIQRGWQPYCWSHTCISSCTFYKTITLRFLMNIAIINHSLLNQTCCEVASCLSQSHSTYSSQSIPKWLLFSIWFSYKHLRRIRSLRSGLIIRCMSDHIDWMWKPTASHCFKWGSLPQRIRGPTELQPHVFKEQLSPNPHWSPFTLMEGVQSKSMAPATSTWRQWARFT